MSSNADPSDDRRAPATGLDCSRSILETLREPFLVLDGDLRVVSANHAFHETFELHAEETEGSCLYALGDRRWDIPELRALLDDVLQAKSSLTDVELIHVFPSLGRRILLLNARRVHQPDDPSTLVLLSICDITERRRLEEETARAEVRFRRVIEAVKDYAIFSLDIQGRPTSWNRGVERVLGFAEDAFIGKDVIPLIFTPEDLAAGVPRRELDEAARNGSSGNDRWMMKKNGERFFAFGTTTAIYDGDPPKLTGYTKVTRDETDRKRMEETLAAAATALSEQNRRKDEFLAMLSHELRNPLAPIRSAVHVLKVTSQQEIGRSESNPLASQAREIIERQVGHLTKIVNDLLEVSRLETGRIRLELQVIDINAVVRFALETVQPAIVHFKHTLAVHTCGQPLWTNADATRLEEVFVNILTNAAKYTEAGGRGRIEVACERSGDRASIRVRDNGVGIEPALLPRIFDLFTQADRSLERSGGGLGIGLSIVKRLVEMHGGIVEAFSPPHAWPAVDGAHGAPLQGSEFVVTLPLVDAPRATPPEAAKPKQPGEGVRVLLVDDNIDLVTMVSMGLRSRGYTVQAAHTGPAALEMAERWRPDVFLLDIGLPGLDGYQVARRLRAHPMSELNEARLIALTGYGRETDVAMARDAGFDAHLVKPYDLDELDKLMARPGRSMRATQ